MTDQSKLAPKDQDFLQATEADVNEGLTGNFVGFMRENAKWWLIPFAVVFGLLGILLILGSTGAAPFIYTLF